MADPRDLMIGEMVCEQPELFDCSVRNALQAGTFINVLKVNERIFTDQVGPVGNNRWPLDLAQRDRFEQRIAFYFFEQKDVVEDVDQVNAPKVLRSGFAGDEEILLAQRPGMEELGPALHRQLVLNKRLDFLAVAGDSLDDTVGGIAAQRRIENHQFADPSDVVARDDAHHLCRMVGHRPGEENSVGPISPAAVVLSLPRAVGIHREQKPRPDVGDVGVLPAQVENPAVVHHRGAEVMVLFETKLADIAAVGIHQIGHTHVNAGVAWNALKRSCRDKGYLAVRHVAGVKVVYVNLVARGEAAQISAVKVNLINLPELALVWH